MRLASLRLASWIIAFLESMFFDHWQSSMFEGSVVTSYFSEILRVVSSKSSLLIPSGTSMISKHSHLEYWLFPQHCLCNATTHSCNLLFTFLETDTSDLTFFEAVMKYTQFLVNPFDTGESHSGTWKSRLVTDGPRWRTCKQFNINVFPWQWWSLYRVN